MTKPRYVVAMVENSKEYGFVVRKMLVARFVAKGDAIAYAMWRRDNQPDGKDMSFHVETDNSVYGGNIFKAEVQS